MFVILQGLRSPFLVTQGYGPAGAAQPSSRVTVQTSGRPRPARVQTAIRRQS